MAFDLISKLHMTLNMYEDPVIIMNQLCFKRLWNEVLNTPPDGAVIPAPDGSGLTLIIDNKVDPLDMMIVERSDRQ